MSEGRKTRSGKVVDTKEKSDKVEGSEPKKPSTSYVLYCQEKREELKKDKPDLKPKQINTELSKMWKALSDEDKKPFEDKNKELKEKYDADLEKYNKDNGIETKKKETKKRSRPAKKAKKDSEDEEEEEEEVKKKKVTKKTKKAKNDEEEEEEEEED
ncbi:HMGB4 [Acrasis kona]|uniref:HMGB4 n=1 Tax=Acrasis kona TaxID=1008807 RepID=A0AAW2YUP9_9EUKA